MTATDQQQEWMDVEGTGRYLDVEPETLYAWRHRKMGPKSYSIGRKVRYRRSDLDAWLEQNSKPGRP